MSNVAGIRKIASLIQILALFIYPVAWMHANRIFSRYKNLGKQRMAEIENRSQTCINDEIEKGLISQKVFNNKQTANDFLINALKIEGGNPTFLLAAGNVMLSNKHFKEAFDFFDRALPGIQDKKTIKALEKTRRSMQ